jgi:uncharacterized protein YyaL (SSP411 family)
MVSRAPRAFATALSTVDFLRESPLELVVAGRATSAEREALEAALAGRYLPRRVIGHVEPEAPPRAGLPLLDGKTEVGGRAALYVCRNYACERPLTNPDEVARALA